MSFLKIFIVSLFQEVCISPFGVNYWEIILFFWQCYIFLFFYVSCCLMLMSVHLKNELPVSVFSDWLCVRKFFIRQPIQKCWGCHLVWSKWGFFARVFGQAGSAWLDVKPQALRESLVLVLKEIQNPEKLSLPDARTGLELGSDQVSLDLGSPRDQVYWEFLDLGQQILLALV